MPGSRIIYTHLLKMWFQQYRSLLQIYIYLYIIIILYVKSNKNVYYFCFSVVVFQTMVSEYTTIKYKMCKHMSVYLYHTFQAVYKYKFEQNSDKLDRTKSIWSVQTYYIYAQVPYISTITALRFCLQTFGLEHDY